MSYEKSNSTAWDDLVNKRTRDFLTLQYVMIPLDQFVRAQHWDGRAGRLALSHFTGRTGQLHLHLGSTTIRFDSSEELIAAGWAVSGRVIDPWVGSLFGKQENAFEGLRVLVLGEALHYRHLPIGDGRPYLTILSVVSFLDGTSSAFYKQVTGALDGLALMLASTAHHSEPDRLLTLWNSIAFSNIIPVVASHHPARPSPPLFRLCSPFLEELFSDLKPDIALIFGRRAWQWLNWALVHQRTRLEYTTEPVHTHGAICYHVRPTPNGTSLSQDYDTLGHMLKGNAGYDRLKGSSNA